MKHINFCFSLLFFFGWNGAQQLTAQSLTNVWLTNMNKGYETYPADIQITTTKNVVASVEMIYLDSLNQNHTKAWAVLDKTTGVEVWDTLYSTTGNLAYTATADANDNLYIAEHDNFNLYFKKFNPSGQQLFSTTLPYHRLIYYNDIVTNNYENLSFLPNVAQNKLYLFVDKLVSCNWQPALISIDKTNGTLSNVATLSNLCSAAIHSHCSDANGNLYVLYGNDTTMAVAKWNGTQLQTVIQTDSAGFHLLPRSIRMVDNHLFVQYAVRTLGTWTDLYNVLKVYDANTFAPIQSHFTTKVLDAPRIDNNQYYLIAKNLTIGYYQNNNNLLKKYDTNGAFLWTYTPPTNYSYNDMVIQGNAVFVLTDNGASTQLTVLNKTTGAKDTAFVLPEFHLNVSFVNAGGYKLKVEPEGNANFGVYVSGAVWEPHFSVNRLVAKIGKYLYLPKKVAVEEAYSVDFEVYPNPSKGDFFVKTTGENATLSVHNLLGQVVYKQAITQELATIKLAHLPAGNYILRVQTPNKIGTKRICVEE